MNARIPSAALEGLDTLRADGFAPFGAAGCRLSAAARR